MTSRDAIEVSQQEIIKAAKSIESALARNLPNLTPQECHDAVMILFKRLAAEISKGGNPAVARMVKSGRVELTIFELREIEEIVKRRG